jgi:tetratricopeptide (TPR) repeat protein
MEVDMSAQATYTKAKELEAGGKHGEAAGIYKELVKLSEDPRFFIAYGAGLQRLGHWQESSKNLRRGIDLKPHYCEGDARLLLAESLHQMGKKKEAIQQWKLVAAMQPEYPSYEAVPNEAKKRLAESAA